MKLQNKLANIMLGSFTLTPYTNHTIPLTNVVIMYISDMLVTFVFSFIADIKVGRGLS